MKRKGMVIAALCASLSMSALSAMAADNYENNKNFTDKTLPESSGNVTLASAKKTTNRSYGRIKVTDYSHCDAISCWFRTTVDGTQHYWLPYMVTVDDKSYHKVKCCDADSSYYKKGVKAEMRAENADEEWDFWTETVSGKISFN